MKKIYQLILVFYLSIGISVSGYYFIYPNYYKTGVRNFLEGREYIYEKGNEFGVSVLATIVGSVLIGGIGLVMRKPK
jgi:hypothetical protein